MKTAIAASLFLIFGALAPMAVMAEDSDKDRTSAKDFVKDSVITTKIKTKLAEEKLSSTVRIKVDTENKGIVVLSGTAKTQAEIDKAGSIARGVEGVSSVQNNIQLASTSATRAAKGASATEGATRATRHEGRMYGDSSERVEAGIKEMHARLMITQAQEEQWAKVAQVMRDNAKQMDALTKTRAERAQMSAVDDLKSYGEITDAHADGIKKLTPVFGTLYDTMTPAQKKTADNMFDRRGRKPV